MLQKWWMDLYKWTQKEGLLMKWLIQKTMNSILLMWLIHTLAIKIQSWKLKEIIYNIIKNKILNNLTQTKKVQFILVKKWLPKTKALMQNHIYQLWILRKLTNLKLIKSKKSSNKSKYNNKSLLLKCLLQKCSSTLVQFWHQSSKINSRC